MALSHVELYEALKPSIGERAAAMIADVVPAAQDLATKADIADVRADIAELRTEMYVLNTRTIRWTVGVFVPMFAVMWASIIGLYFAR